MKNNYKFPLMKNNIIEDDINRVINYLQKNKKKGVQLTQGKYVEKFEREWSKWLGVKYSIYVNSGSSANFITIAGIKNIIKKKTK